MKVSDKLAKVNDSVNVYIYDNGFMVEVGGRNEEDDWSQVKIICNDLDKVNAVLQEVVKMEKA